MGGLAYVALILEVVECRGLDPQVGNVCEIDKLQNRESKKVN